jgi:hypothetical protein
LHCCESAVEWRLRNGKRRKEDQQSKEDERGMKPAQRLPAGNRAPNGERMQDIHRHLQRPEGRDMPKRKPESLTASNNFLEVGYNQIK